MAKTKPIMQEYIALVTIASEDGSERWVPGSKILLDDTKAEIHLRLGNVIPMENTTVPPQPEPVLIIHVPETTEVIP
jgi:hypothetical protein